MKFLKKNVKVIVIAIVGMIIGMLITGGIVFATGQYNASEVRYDTTSVAGALDNLYNYAKNKSDLAEQMQKPNTWTVGTEYNFGDGVYGKRIQYNGSTNDVVLIPSSESSNTTKIFSWGGSFRNNNNNVWSLPAAGDNMNLIELWRNDSGSTYDWHLQASSNGSEWDIWILYTK
mgnify:CR=1 FL=1